ncbi:MAG: acyltransferase [Chloroflexota bacterium]
MSPIIVTLSRLIVRLTGWKLVGEMPKEKKFMLLAGPHTSLWDGVWMVLAAFSWGIRADYLVKRTYAEGPFGRAVLWSGGIPVMAGAKGNKVQEVVEMVENRGKVNLLIAPAGTRVKRDMWRSGFYHIAKGANLPVYCSYLDFKTRTMGIDSVPLYFGDDVKKDMDHIRSVYAGKMGKFPEMMTPIKIREEEEPEPVQ